jgi:hypothetical protein
VEITRKKDEKDLLSGPRDIEHLSYLNFKRLCVSSPSCTGSALYLIPHPFIVVVVVLKANIQKRS